MMFSRRKLLAGILGVAVLRKFMPFGDETALEVTESPIAYEWMVAVCGRDQWGNRVVETYRVDGDEIVQTDSAMASAQLTWNSPCYELHGELTEEQLRGFNDTIREWYSDALNERRDEEARAWGLLP